MITDQEMLEEWKRDEMNEARMEMEADRLMRTDFDYALEHLGLGPDITVSEFAQVLYALKELGYDISANELMNLI